MSRIGGEGITEANDDVYVREAVAGGFEVVVQEGDRAPGTPDGVIFDRLIDDEYEPSFVHNAEGRIAFLAGLEGPDITSDSDYGIWAEGLDGQLELIVREGDLLDVSDDPHMTDLRLVTSVLFAGGQSQVGNDDGEQSGFNDHGQVAFFAAFDDGSQGVFVSDRVASLPGDFNGDGAVDAADYTVWRDGLGTTYTEADFEVWLDHFGTAEANAVHSVPEPTSFALIMFVGAALMRRSF